MPSPTELALSNLLPTISLLPPDLSSLANSLLAQSRSKAASLKPEEEIGRVYACAHIAAERLKKRLDLELDKPKPPCPPKVYKKLYAYLDGVLSVPTPRTPRKSLAGGGGIVARRTLGNEGGSAKRGKAEQGDVVVTPSASASASASKTKTPTTAIKRARDTVTIADAMVGQTKAIPDFVMPLVRDMCKAARTPKAVPHVVVGAEAVGREIASRIVKRGLDTEPVAKRRRTRTPQSTKGKEVVLDNTGDAVALEKWPALVVALHLCIVARMRGVEIDAEDIVELRERVVEAVEQYVILNALSLPKDLESITVETLKKPVDFYLLEAEDCGWLVMEWYRNVPENIVEEDDVADEEDEDVEMMEDDDGPSTPRKRPAKTPLRRKEKRGGKVALAAESVLDGGLGAAGLLPGLGTMFQPAIDWLSDEKRADYVRWKKGILKECAAVEANA